MYHSLITNMHDFVGLESHKPLIEERCLHGSHVVGLVADAEVAHVVHNRHGPIGVG